jgi:hypothetical protein
MYLNLNSVFFSKHKRNKKLLNTTSPLLNVKGDANLTNIESPKSTIPTRDIAQLVDFISGFIFPIIFIIFNIIYWYTYFNLVSIFDFM